MTREDNQEKERYEQQTVPTQQSILQLEEAAEKMEKSVDELKPFEVIKHLVSSLSEHFCTAHTIKCTLYHKITC